MTDPFSAAQAAITKWVSARIAAGLDTALRQRQLAQGRPAPDQQAELAAVIKAAVEQTAAELFPGQDRLQGNFRKTLLQGRQRDWPLVNGTDLDDVVSDVHAWILDNDPRPGGGKDPEDPAAHPYLQVLCRGIIAQFGLRAENNGAKNSVLYPRWSRFWTTELFTGRQAAAAAPAPAATAFRNDFHGPVGVVVQGQQVTVNADTAAGPVWPCRFGTVPPLTAARQDRAVDQRLAAALAGGSTALVCQILAGMGGVGKSQVAAAYAEDRWRQGEVEVLVWVDASSREAIIATFAQAGGGLCGADPGDADRAAQAFLAWLARPEAPRWLVVLDDLADPADLHGWWPPASSRGRTIVTTRRRDAALDAHGRQRIDVDLFTPGEALGFLTDRLGHDPSLLDGAADLARDLGYLPLALGQAAAYVLDRPGMTCNAYRDLLADREVKLDHLSPEALAEDYPRPLAAALALAIERADEYEPTGLATVLLSLASLLDPAGIPADLFTALPLPALPGSENEHASGADEASSAVVPPRVIDEALARLHRLSLINHDGTTIRVHALVQRACRDRLDDHTRTAIARIDADALDRIWPKVENHPARSAMLRANVARLRDHAETALLQPEAHPILFRQGESLGRNGLVGEAAEHFQHLHQRCDHTLGSDHPDTLNARGKFALWRGEAGDATGAAKAFAALLKDHLWVLGPDHPHTLATRGDLAVELSRCGDAAGAAETFAALLNDCLRVLGPDHPHTLATRSNLAVELGEAGDAAGAAEAFAALLNDYLRVLGRDHPHTLQARRNFALWRGETGDAAGAAEAFAALLNDCLRVLGPDHPSTLDARNNLAVWRAQATGEAAEAARAFAALLKDRLRVLGPDHPDTLTTRNNLAVMLGEAGDAAGAAEAFTALLNDYLRVLGPDHPDTLSTSNNLALWRERAVPPEDTSDGEARSGL